ncbi:MAG: hypothetical protein AAFV78_16650, partial [Bacteroidota bacterium]
MQTSDEAPLARVHGIAPGFVAHTYRFEAMLPYSRTRVWTWLNTPETFTKGQPWPYRVEFTSGDPVIPADFSEGVMNVHHGPFLNFAGVLTEIRPPEYRDLPYNSGLIGLYFLYPKLQSIGANPPLSDGKTPIIIVQISVLRRSNLCQ